MYNQSSHISVWYSTEKLKTNLSVFPSDLILILIEKVYEVQLSKTKIENFDQIVFDREKERERERESE